MTILARFDDKGPLFTIPVAFSSVPGFDTTLTFEKGLRLHRADKPAANTNDDIATEEGQIYLVEGIGHHVGGFPVMHTVVLTLVLKTAQEA